MYKLLKNEKGIRLHLCYFSLATKIRKPYWMFWHSIHVAQNGINCRGKLFKGRRNWEDVLETIVLRSLHWYLFTVWYFHRGVQKLQIEAQISNIRDSYFLCTVRHPHFHNLIVTIAMILKRSQARLSSLGWPYSKISHPSYTRGGLGQPKSGIRSKST